MSTIRTATRNISRKKTTISMSSEASLQWIGPQRRFARLVLFIVDPKLDRKLRAARYDGVYQHSQGRSRSYHSDYPQHLRHPTRSGHFAASARIERQFSNRLSFKDRRIPRSEAMNSISNCRHCVEQKKHAIQSLFSQ